MSNREYWACRARDGEIVVKVPQGDDTSAQMRKVLSEGFAVQFYSGFVDLKDWARTISESAQVWYTERNGDGIGMLCPAGTSPDALPSVAMDYMAFEWIDPENEFGSGIVPVARRKKRAVLQVPFADPEE